MKTKKVIMAERIVVKLEAFKSTEAEREAEVQVLRKEIEMLKAKS